MKHPERTETCGEMELLEEARERQVEYTKEEQRWIALGALKAGLLIGAVYLVGLALVIGLLLAVWN